VSDLPQVGPKKRSHLLKRRSLLFGASAAAAGLLLPRAAASAPAGATRTFRLKAAPGRSGLVPATYGETETWSYNGTVPGPEIRVRQGDRLRIVVDNELPEETTVHWHGLRVPNAMDGVPHLNQPPIRPGERFVYEFEVPDAGTFWYHPHTRSNVQVERGLSGALVVEEPEPIRVDRDLIWVVDDWRLDRSAAISADFDNPHDLSHAGRLGNTVTVNGRVPEDLGVRAGERVRLRIVNAANARILGLHFGGHEPWVVALDGQPTAPHRPTDDTVVIGPAGRADVVLDMTGAPGTRAVVVDQFYRDFAYELVGFVYDDLPLRTNPPDWPMELAANPLPEPDMASAIRHEVILNGGMMGAMVMAEMGGSMGEQSTGGMTEMMRGRGIWFINGKAATGHALDPMLIFARDRSHVVEMTNATAFHHPMHLHGHSFRVVSRNGVAAPIPEWRDTVLMAPREKIEIAFVADNPGDWMFHCHVLEHQAAGMMAVVRVA
jgi:FtsP/CotA-like multicopper oxidase with cupredoxin domain